MRYFIFILLTSILSSCGDMLESNPIRTTGIYTGKYRDLMNAARNEDLETMGVLVKKEHITLDYADSANGVCC